MACTWENMTFAPEGKEREGSLGWHFNLIHFYNPCTMKVYFWVQKFSLSCLHSNRNQREIILKDSVRPNVLKKRSIWLSEVVSLLVFFTSYIEFRERPGGQREVDSSGRLLMFMCHCLQQLQMVSQQPDKHHLDIKGYCEWTEVCVQRYSETYSLVFTMGKVWSPKCMPS